MLHRLTLAALVAVTLFTITTASACEPPRPGLGPNRCFHPGGDPPDLLVEKALVAARNAAACPTTPAKVTSFVNELVDWLKLRPSEHPAFGGVTGHHAPGSLHPLNRAVDLNGDRTILVALHKALEGSRKADFCLLQASVEDNHFHLGFMSCNPKEGDCEALNGPPLDR